MKFRILIVLLPLCLLAGQELQAQKAIKSPRNSVSMEQQRYHVFFTGKVQGVYFRATTQEYARELQLTGWVRNLRDGRVEMQVQGPAPDLKKLLDRLDQRFEINKMEKRRMSMQKGPVGFEVLR